MNFIKRNNSNKSKHLLVENELKKLNNFEAADFRSKNVFGDDGAQNYLVFQTMNRCFKKIGKTKSISSCKSKGLPDEVIKSPTINNKSLAPKLEYLDKKMFVKFDRSCLIKRDKFTFNEKTVNIYIVYDLDSNLNNFDTTLQNCLFGAVKLTKNSDIDKYQYSCYGTGFDSKGSFPHPTGNFGQNAIIFGVDMSSSTHATNRTRNILVLGRDFIQGIDNTTIYAGKIYSINFSTTRRRFFSSLHYNGDNSYLSMVKK